VIARPAVRGALTLAAVLLAIEFLDELVFSAREAAWPAIRADLDLSYTQIGLLLGLPNIVSAVLEPGFGVLADTRWRAAVMVGGGVAFSVGMLIAAVSPGFVVILVAFSLLYPASGAFVSTAQATLIDASNGRHEHEMARWTFAGSIGVAAGPIVLWAAYALGASWRVVFALFAAMAVVLAFALVRRLPRHLATAAADADEPAASPLASLRAALEAARRRDVWRWLVLLAFSDLLMDVFFGFVALFLVDSVGLTEQGATGALIVFTTVGLIGDGLVILVLRRVPGLRYVRATAAISIVVYPLFLLSPSFALTLAALSLIGLLNSGWYPVLKAGLYGALPGRSGAVLALSSAFGLATAFVPTALGLVADRYGVEAAMWLLLAGPAALVLLIPRQSELTTAD
jgi:FSR family fosmidomycin resistance protein-like MFS transporter